MIQSLKERVGRNAPARQSRGESGHPTICRPTAGRVRSMRGTGDTDGDQVLYRDPSQGVSHRNGRDTLTFRVYCDKLTGLCDLNGFTGRCLLPRLKLCDL